MSLMMRFALLALLVPLAAQAAPKQAEFWLERMMKAVHDLNYDGYFVYLHGDNIESLRTIHTVKNGREIERLYSLNGAAREIVRDDNSVTQILPDERAIATTKRITDKNSFSGFFRLDPEVISQNYELVLGGHGRIADRSTNIISFQPRDQLRYGYRLHLDDEHALPLQWEMFDHDNFLVSSIMFTKIDIGSSVSDSGPLLDDGIQAAVSPDAMNDAAMSSKAVAMTGPWQFSSVPVGFEIRHHRQGLPQHGDRDVEHYIFSDGIASFSVYIELTDKVKFEGLAHLGALNAYGTYVDGYQVTAVGEVPPNTLTFIDDLQKRN